MAAHSTYDRAVYEFRRGIGYYARFCPTCGEPKPIERYCAFCPRPQWTSAVSTILDGVSSCAEGKRTPKPPCRLTLAEWPLPHRHCQSCDAPCATSQRLCGACMVARVLAPDGHCQLCSDPTDTLFCAICNQGVTRNIQRALGVPMHQLAYTPRLEDEQHSVERINTVYSTLDERGGDQRAALTARDEVA